MPVWLRKSHMTGLHSSAESARSGFVLSVCHAMLASISFAPLSTRPSCSSADLDDPEDELLILSIGSSFKYVIPRFDVLAVSMRPMRIRVNYGGRDRAYDIFVRSDPSLNGRMLPAIMSVKDFEVRDFCSLPNTSFH